MDAFRWIQMFVFVILELQITVTEQFSSVIVKEGDDATLPCKHVIANQDECNNTYWIHRDADLVIQGQIQENNKIKSDRLSVAANCSLVVKKVTSVDGGHYHCQQHRSGPDTQVILSTLNMDEREESGHVELYCSVRTDDSCRHTVQWRYEGENVHEDLHMSKQGCRSDARFPTSNLELKLSYLEVFKCEVTDGFTKEKHLFTFSSQSSGDDTTTAKTEVTIRTTVNNHKPGTISATSAVWWYIIAAVGLVALLIIVVVVIRWKKTEEEKEKKAQRDEEMRLGSNPAVTQSAPETSQDTVDPEDGVSYASVSYTKKTNSKARVRVEDDGDGEGDAVTYSTVKVSPSSAEASTDPSNIYASINDNPNK